MSKYRIVEHHPSCFEPQIWRWWWPIWSALHMCSYTGHDWSPLSCTTRTEAEDLIRMHITPVRVAPVVHDYPPNILMDGSARPQQSDGGSNPPQQGAGGALVRLDVLE
jgi:hypothetical protein